MQVSKGRAPKINNTKLPPAFSLNKSEDHESNKII